jgi:CDP-diacylglycerol--glycerol-3-phosphate 3-phosphatidyltransferase
MGVETTDSHDRSQPPLRVQHGRIMTAGNLMSMARVAILPFLLYAIAQPPTRDWILVCAALAAAITLTDALDGFIARRLNQVSEIGKILDPVADKICIGFVSIWLVLYRGLPIWIPAVILARDIFIVGGSIVIARKVDVIMPSHQAGRITTVVVSVTFFIYVIDWVWPQQVLVWLSGALIAFTFLLYWRIGQHMLKSGRQ